MNNQIIGPGGTAGKGGGDSSYSGYAGTGGAAGYVQGNGAYLLASVAGTTIAYRSAALTPAYSNMMGFNGQVSGNIYGRGGANPRANDGSGGSGGFAMGLLLVNPGQVLTIIVGAGGHGERSSIPATGGWVMIEY